MADVSEKETTPSQTPGTIVHGCPTCRKSFTRLEHLKRHLLTHSNERKFVCDHCHKGFPRRDALQRHFITHSEPATVQAKGSRACLNCAAAKTRCSGGVPCSRCTQRQQDCRYPDGKMAQTSTLMPGSPNGSISLARESVAEPKPPSNHARAPDEHRDLQIIQQEVSQIGDHSDYPDRREPELSTIASHMATESQYIQPSTNFENQSFFPDPLTGRSSAGLDPNYWIPGGMSSVNWLTTDFSASDFDLEQFSGADPYWDNTQAFYFDGAGLQQITPIAPSDGSLQSMAGPSASPLATSTVSSASPGNVSTIERPREAGEFYVDGENARLPRVKRRKLTASKQRRKPSTIVNTQFSLAYSWQTSEGQQPSTGFGITHAYRDLFSAFEYVCLNITSSSPGVDVGNANYATPLDHRSPSMFSSIFAVEFPTIAVLEHLIRLYIENFQPLLPIIHPRDFYSLTWQSLLAVCAIGAHFVEGASSEFASSMHEFLRRVLRSGEEIPSWNPTTQIELAQLKVLHAVGAAYCGHPRLQQHAFRIRLDLPANEFSQVHTASSLASLQDKWRSWKHGETARRTRFAIWLLDSMWRLHFQQRPTLSLDDAGDELPCHEQIWGAASAEEWQSLSEKYSRTPKLTDALQQLYMEKKLLTDLSEFSRILLIHGIMRRTFEVEAYYEQPLSRWTPVAEKQSSEELTTNSPVWLPSVEAFARWRNSACDCLDILHWSANATIGVQSGLEHPTVLHLHVARVGLLTPHRNIVNLAEYLVGESPNRPESEITHDKQVIRRWVTMDQYKARLAMIHAAVLFWHIRRFSANGFYEPPSIALAVLSLWAFSAFSDRAKPSAQPSRSPRDMGRSAAVTPDSDDDEEATCDIILLDRPTDDELVQQFVRRGNTMRANMNGVGDLFGPRAPERVLIEGKKLLSSSCWGERDRWMRVLDKLAAVCRRQYRQRKP